MLERLAEKNAQKVRIIKVNAVKHSSWASEEHVRGVPAFRLYRGGTLVERFVGAYPEKQIQGKIDKYAPVFDGSSSGSKAHGDNGKNSKEPTVQPMPKGWMPAGVTRD